MDNNKKERFRAYFDTDHNLHAVANSACKLLQPKEFFYEFVNTAIKERLEKLTKEGKLPEGLLAMLNEEVPSESK